MTITDQEKFQEGIWCGIGLILLIPLIFYHAFVGYKIYTWFAPENFPTLPFTTFLLFTLLLGHFRKSKDILDSKFRTLVPASIITPSLTLLFADICKIILDHFQ
jgi:hypothetical protein